MPKAQTTMSISEFHKLTPISTTHNAFQEKPMFKNALNSSSTVWENMCGHDANTLTRMKPWLPGPMVVKRSFNWDQADRHLQMAHPSNKSRKRLQEERARGTIQ